MAGGRTLTAEVVNNLNIATQDFIDATVSLLTVDDVVRARLMKKSKPTEGGKQIEFPLIIDEENTRTTGKVDPYDLSLKEILDAAFYDWKYVEGNMVLPKKDIEVINTGKERIIDLAEKKVMNMRDSMNKKFARLLYTPVASLTSKDPDSLVKICATKNNTVGGIDASICVGGSGTITQPFSWNPTVLDYSTASITYSNLVNSTSNYYIMKLLRRIVGPLTIGQDKPTMVIVTQGIWDAYEEVLTALKRVDSARMEVDGGYDALSFRRIPIVVDNNCPGGQLDTGAADNSGMILVLNENYLQFKHSSNYGSSDGEVGMRWTPWHELETQPVVHSILEWAGTFGCNRRDRQGAILGLPTDSQVYA